MRERVKRTFFDFEKAIQNLKIAVEKAVDDLDIDGVIKRFELCYELSWKAIRIYLEDLGIICKNPRECFKQAKINGLIEDEITWMEMIETRNRLVHEYSAEFSREIFEEIKTKYVKILEDLYKTLKERLSDELV
ncbi:HI0074 family nucleotidyltransferase substrate-binding subunit [Thermodesulfovibrio sp. 3462-1]|jgi:nucleotidyltransferase substrate binding protein (TIGR01987 family)|uniref:HI0074 family nucleotidyltransferase substrate-binding subunit n=1 Tax=Thermodesulfovibrio obliviosus TaxID=3118332 RepID=A0AAU8H689_9BACT